MNRRMTRRLVTALLALNVHAVMAYQCMQCIPGKYKSEIANNVCVQCPSNTYLNYSGADDRSDCIDCPANMQSPWGTDAITGCICNVGFYGPPGGPCTRCQTGTYAAVAGQASCTACPANQDSPLQSDEITDCACVQGYTGPNGGNCSKCDFNTYKTTTGNHSCTSCVVNTMTLQTGNSNPDSCICTPGYFQNYSNLARSCGVFGTESCPVTSSTAPTSAWMQQWGFSGASITYINDGVEDTKYVASVYPGENGNPNWYRIDLEKQSWLLGVYVLLAWNSPESNWWNFAIGDGTSWNSVGNNVCKSDFDRGLPVNGLEKKWVTVTCDKIYKGRYLYIYKFNDPPKSVGHLMVAEVVPFGYLDQCSNCLAGTYKPLPGPSQCTNCAVHKYSTATAATSNTTCQNCPANTVSASGSGVLTACKCNLGYTSPSGDGLACDACVQGKYKTATGSQACTDCDLGKYSGAVALTTATCTSCDLNQMTNGTGKDELADCRCNAGFTGNDGTHCFACDAGKYKPTTGDATCTLCPQDRYLTTTAATSGAACLACPTSSQAPTGSSAKAACICNMGYTGPGGSAGDPPAFIGGTPDMTVPCGENWNSNCNLAIYKPASRSDGYDAYQIVSGHYTSTASVDAGSYTAAMSGWPTGSQYSQYFQVDLQSSRTVTSGLWWGNMGERRGSVRIGNTNVNTAAYRTLIANNPAEYHPSFLGSLCAENLGATEHTYFTCISPIVGRYVYLLSNTPDIWFLTDIILRGYNGPWYGYCNACVAGTYKPTNGSATCTNCVADTYSTVVAATSNTCVGCPLYMQSAVASGAITNCKCNAGYTGSDGVLCVGCVAGKYKTVVGSVLCSNCAVNTFSTAVNKSDASCTTCLSVTTGPSQSLAGSALQTDCKCNMGYSGSDGSTCIACPLGAYKPSVGNATCSLCPTNTYQPALARTASSDCLGCPDFSLSLQASDQLTDCECQSGYFGANGGTCSECYAGKFKPLKGPQDCDLCPNGTYSGVFAATSNGVCDACQENSLSWAGSTVLTDCKCDSGFFTENFGTPTVYCRTCGNGTYNTHLNATACSKCAAGLYSTAIGAKTGEVCLKCTSGFSGEGYAQCDACPPHATAEIASSFLTDCKCNPGYTGPDGGTCEECVTGKFKPYNGSNECSNCPLHTYLPYTGASLETECLDCYDNSITLQTGSATVYDCKCSIGYTSTVSGMDGNECEACTQGKYKNTTGHYPCALCPVNTYLDATGSTLISQCEQCFSDSVSNEGSPTVESCACVGGFERHGS